MPTKPKARSTKPAPRTLASPPPPPTAAAFEAALSEARGRRNIKLFNGLMSKHARFGELERVEQALAALQGLRPPLPPNEYTYGILLNAYTRGGATERCEPLLAEMRARGVAVTSVAYTTVIKGFVHALDMRHAWACFERLLAEAPPLTIRTINTMLRGCLYVGDLAGSERLMGLAAAHGLQPDRVSCLAHPNSQPIAYGAQLPPRVLILPAARPRPDQATRDAAVRVCGRARGGGGGRAGVRAAAL